LQKINDIRLFKQICSPALGLIFIYIAFVALFIFLGISRQQPLMFADELGYLGNARYIAGTADMPDLKGVPFYHFGYSLLIAPLFRIFTDPGATYRAIMVFNAFLMCSILFFSYWLSSELLGLKRSLAILVAVVVSVYPSFFLMSRLAWGECIFIPGLFSLIYSFYKMVETKKITYVFLTGFLCSFLYTIHPRGLAVIGISVLYILFLSGSGVISIRHMIVIYGTIFIIYFFTQHINHHLLLEGWNNQAPSGLPRILQVIKAMSPASLLSNFFKESIGQIYYLMTATFGITLYAGYFTYVKIRETINARSISNNDHVLIFIWLVSLVIFASSVMMLIDGGWGIEHLIYGRYNEAFLPILLTIGLSAVVDLEKGFGSRNFDYFLLVIFMIWVAVFFAVRFDLLTARTQLNPPMVFAVWHWTKFPLNRLITGPFIARLCLFSILSIGCFGAVSILKKNGRSTLAIFLVFLLFLAGFPKGWFSYYRYPDKQPDYKRGLASRVSEIGYTEDISYDVAVETAYVNQYGTYQYFMPRNKFNRYDSSRENPASPVFITSSHSEKALKAGAVLIAKEEGIDNALWIKPGIVQRRYSEYLETTNLIH
jgi:hypothetical protein